MSTDRLLGALMPMIGASEALAAVAASLRLRRDGGEADPELAARLGAVLDALDLRDAVGALDRREATALLGIAESSLAQATAFARNPEESAWTSADDAILLAQGHMSALLGAVFERFVVPSLDDGLAARLSQPGASFLDVGTGVGGLAIAVARVWPTLRVVGIDQWDRALALARAQVGAVGLGDRIELREVAAEALEEVDAHELAWVPTFFVSSAVLESVAERVHASLRPGGWAMFGQYARPDDPFRGALAELRTVRHGGAQQTPAELLALVERAGFGEVGVRADGKGPLIFVVGRRAATAS